MKVIKLIPVTSVAVTPVLDTLKSALSIVPLSRILSTTISISVFEITLTSSTFGFSSFANAFFCTSNAPIALPLSSSTLATNSSKLVVRVTPSATVNLTLSFSEPKLSIFLISTDLLVSSYSL
ncbi:hypothetical protein [Acetivibrio straminisolvens]|uniref:hypothetical protein n=1 Tax=Acetivibrio straminisolvens TaxID=253314 RepID=UPI001FB08762|nr:hypothetical protein [Acetivibrio straminisolvens]